MSSQPGLAPRDSARRIDVLAATLLALAAGLAPLLAWPTANIGFNDDWSYARMAFDVASKNTYQLDGWAAAAVGPQAYWGALFVRLFGPTAFVLRCSTLILAAALAVLIYAMARRSGLRTAAAAQASAACMLSPLVIPLSCSFMTDAPGLFAGLVAVLLASLAVRAESARTATAWFAASLVAGFAGGLVRQTVWMVPLLVAPLAIVLASNRSKAARAAWAAMTLATAGLIVARIRRDAQAPFAAIDDLPDAIAGAILQPVAVLRVATAMAMTLIFVLAPALIAARRPLLFRPRRQGVWIAAAIVTVPLAGLVVTSGSQLALLNPWVGNLVQTTGLIELETDVPGEPPVLIPRPLSAAAAVLAWATLVTLLAAGIQALRDGRGGVRAAIDGALRAAKARPELALLATFGVAAVALGVTRAATSGVYDRYLLPILPPAVIGLLLMRQRGATELRASRTAWLAIAAGAALGLAFTFDYHAALRAREAATDRLIAAGVPRARISGGFEFDGETQLLVAGHVNNPRVRVPAGGFVPLAFNPAWRGPLFLMWPYAMNVQPEYLVLRTERADWYEDAGFGTVSYHSCFPPFRRELHILRLRPPFRDVPPLVPAN